MLGGWGGRICLQQTLPLLPLQLLIPCLSMHCIVCKVLPHVPFHLTPKAVLGAGQGGIIPPFAEEEKEVLRSKLPCSGSHAQLGDGGGRRWGGVGPFHHLGQHLPFQE